MKTLNLNSSLISQGSPYLNQLQVRDGIAIFHHTAPELPDDLHKFQGVTLGICSAGEAEYSVNLHKRLISKGQVFITRPTDMMRVERMSDDFTVNMVLMTEPFMEKLRADTKKISDIVLSFRFNIDQTLSDVEMEEVDMYFRLMQEHNAGFGRFKMESLGTLLMSLVYRLGSMLDKPGAEIRSAEVLSSRKEYHFKEFLILLTKHFNDQRSVKFYADNLYITPKHLSAVVKEVSGKTPIEWINDYVLTEAKTLLKHTDQSVQEIAYHLNFQSPSFFGKYFKRLSGTTPNQFRRAG